MKYVPGPMFGQFSGSQGNTTAARNPWSAYVRNRTTPVNPATPAQGAVRANLQAISQAWRTLTDGVRGNWAALGDSIERTNSLGAVYSLSGLQAFELVNRNRFSLGQTILTAAPSLDEAPTVGTLTLTAAEGTPAISLAFTGTVTSPEGWLIDMTAGVSQGINFLPRSRFKRIFATSGSESSPIDLLSSWQAIYGDAAPAAGTKLFARVVTLSLNRFAGPPVIVSTIVGA